MPYHGHARKKTRTHVTDAVGAITSEKVPKSFVLRRGKVDKSVRELVEDFRALMAPHTAARLRERKCVPTTRPTPLPCAAAPLSPPPPHPPAPGAGATRSRTLCPWRAAWA